MVTLAAQPPGKAAKKGNAMSKHTSGPWKAYVGNGRVRVSDEHGLAAIAECFQDAEANARLIAAAPDLFEVARLSLLEIDKLLTWAGLSDVQRDALAALYNKIELTLIRAGG